MPEPVRRAHLGSLGESLMDFGAISLLFPPASQTNWLGVMAFASTTPALTCERAGSDPPTRSVVLARLPAGH